MGEFKHVIATTAEDLVRVHEVVRDQEFKLSEVRRDEKKGLVDLLFLRKFPPHKGLWFLRIPRVRRWKIDHKALHDLETLKEIRWDAKSRTVTLRCVLDEYAIEVDALDLRLGRLDEDDPSKVKFDDLPEWLKAEVREQDAAHEVEIERVRLVRRIFRNKAAIAGTMVSFLYGLVAGGDPWVLVLACPILAGGAGYFLFGSSLSPQAMGPIWGVIMFAAGSAGGLPNPIAALFGALMLVCGGVYMGVWLRGEEDLHR